MTYNGNKIDDYSTLRLSYKQDNVTCSPNWKAYYYSPKCIITSYPKEWIAAEIDGDALLGHDLAETITFEPWWKLIIANKAILPYLWQKYPNHKNLLPAYFEDPRSEFDTGVYDKAFKD